MNVSALSYDSLIIVFSIIIVFCSSSITLNINNTLFESVEKTKVKGILFGTLVLELGIWSIQFFDIAALPVDLSLITTLLPMSSNYINYIIGIIIVMTLLFSVFNLHSNKVKLLSDEYTRQFDSLIETATDGIVVTDDNGIITQWNQGAESLFGYDRDEVIDQNVRIIFPDAYPPSCSQELTGPTREFIGLKKDGNQFPVELSTGYWKTVRGDYHSLIIRDITDRRNSEEKISNLVYLDSLTGLPNRRLYNDRLESTLDQAIDNSTIHTVLYLNLDQFKLINDTYGHQTGDQLLIEVAHRIKSCISKADTLARLGSDEFILLLPHSNYTKAEAVARNILNVLNQAFSLNDEEVFITPSIGASLFPADGTDSETLVKNADIAMYRVKEEGKNNFQFFTSEMNDLISRKSKIAMSIRKGLELGEFSVYYQPQIDIETERIIGVEALVRWNHAKLGPISPTEFIPIAEENGMILHIGEFVLRTACQQTKAWQDAGVEPFRVAVNISAKQFSQGNISEVITSALEDAQLAPEFLELELTESLIQGATSAITKMQELKAMGIHLSIDDFGTGYSSLSYLKLFPIDSLKIDQYFTRNINKDAKDAALVDTIIQMARNLGLNVIAEGVETLDQLVYLKNKHCNQAQGYYFQKPLLPERIEELYSKV
ncbi:diguanylate cyclase/phosphodiesterase (GGDEF & EAL domains) with PAS/PAC sensor(s) [Planococcus halocryophilus Or1]|uniref:Diguanylate cyclase n=1 Tax=Planococcus halocryophilus TaxID=1215089 RepID=A0A1C7DRA7_9BACL|nr:EAL domain-containing protein [Planococcus halocryophilus]ANU13917.1 diguanylate cyclase [Planococcus halocryophilus]EMF47493.1 diguanylate cyclase/phosphodiesterase (GGDEF & EAL domains) with PAS/PAC sensor(s) [Planococcus halocryophilus Or1]